MLKEFRFIGSSVGDLEGGRQVAPGDFTGPIDATLAHHAEMIERGVLLEVPDGTFKDFHEEDPPQPVLSNATVEEALDDQDADETPPTPPIRKTPAQRRKEGDPS